MSTRHDPMGTRQLRRAWQAILLVLALSLLVGLTITAARWSAGDSLKNSIKSASFFHFRKIVKGSGLDSWGPMIAAHTRQTRFPGGATYADSLELDNCKFQYPPSSLLLLEVLPRPTLPVQQFFCSRDADNWVAIESGVWKAKFWIDEAARWATVGTMLVAGLVLIQSLTGGLDRRSLTRSPGRHVLMSSLALGLTFYPLLWGYELGQIQVFLNLLAAGAVLAVLQGRATLAGVLMGLCSLFKPQYAVLLVWALLRRDRRFGGGLLAVFALVNGLALWKYGWAVHAEYIDFLRGLSRHGETFWANQSVNGILNRWFETANPVEWADWGFASSAPIQVDRSGRYFAWEPAGFPPFHPFVYGATVVTSGLFLLAALLPAHWRGGAALSADTASSDDATMRALDFCAVLAACTLAAPIAWQHHFGTFLPMFALLLGVVLTRCVPAGEAVAATNSWLPWALGLSYLLMAGTLLRPEIVFADRWLGLWGSHLWVGAVLCFVLLLVLRRSRVVVIAPVKQGS